MHFGGLPGALRVLLCGRWCFHASCGVYGGKGIIEVLRTMKSERALEELKLLFFYTLYLWTTTFVLSLGD
jgi:hypothetical protein